MKNLLTTAMLIVFSSLTVACASPQTAPPATPSPSSASPAAELVVLEGFGGGAEPQLMGELAPER